uniref:Uncharacterized protein n=1 Tax=Leptosiphonia brodiei TaxID=2608611 RepID=A0A1Z1MB15_9FLOR|nr:hypothetical protein [Leptosiphonia brodiei]ARW63011.1 hypothetical protein [Leptosiphonia brodiei]
MIGQSFAQEKHLKVQISNYELNIWMTSQMIFSCSSVLLR